MISEQDKKKIRMGTPCVFTYTTRSKQVHRAVPLVDCDMKCDTCGWNPAEQQRRLETGLKNRKAGGRKLVFRRAT